MTYFDKSRSLICVTLTLLLATVGCLGDDDIAGDDDAGRPMMMPMGDAGQMMMRNDSGSIARTDGGSDPGTDADVGSLPDAGRDIDTGGPYTCTQVIGYSQTAEWFNVGNAFESVVDNDRWQLIWSGGAAVSRYADPEFDGWDVMTRSACTSSSEAPDRIVFSISGHHGENVAEWVENLHLVIANIRMYYPSARSIVLQPVVGGPGHEPCMRGTTSIRASWQNAFIDQAIAMVVGGNVIAGISPEVRTCDDYADNVGHLTSEGAVAAGMTIGAYYAD